MKRFVSALVVVMVTLASASVATATHSPSSTKPARDVAVGHGQIDVAAGRFSAQIAAHSGPLGEDPHGRLSAVFVTGARFRAPVTCLFTSGNRATAGGPDLDRPGLAVYVTVEDNDVGPDRLTAVSASTPAFTPDAAGCLITHTLNQPFLSPVTNGNFTVHDGLP